MITEEEKQYIAYQYGEGEVTYEVCNSFGIACLLYQEPKTELCRAEVFDWCYANIGWTSGVSPPAKGCLTVTTIPTGALVTVDGVSCGTTPVTGCELVTGTKTVIITTPGYETATRNVTLIGGQTTNLGTITLTPSGVAEKKIVTFKSVPEGASITILKD